jgi:predicted amidophosphoribosyltransferase
MQFKVTSFPLYLGEYHPYYTDGERNSNFDKFSGLILDLKNKNEKGLNYFTDKLKSYFKYPYPVTIVTIPSHDPSISDNGIRLLAKRILAHYPDWVDGTHCLVRTKLLPRSSSHGRRSPEDVGKSLKVVDTHLLDNKYILLMDDITTSGQSLVMCRSVIQGHVATTKKIHRFALAQTVKYYE